MSISKQIARVELEKLEVPISSDEQPITRETADARGNRKFIQVFKREIKDNEIRDLESSIRALLANEIANDPYKIYAGLNAEQITEAINTPAYDADNRLVREARVAEIFKRVPFAPNAVDLDDVEQAVNNGK